ncbi:GatB/YqeY domain-containing protein [Patescibacteria group bacterium]|nr:GatB/YqeY domain-containing protein [Patescibacteria group bacterium]MBU1705811.1 GatB/YqeY domain-containing protein [Patescibacteria group bacterium]
MSLFEQITIDMKEAMKAKENAKLSTLRLLKSALQNKKIELLHELDESEVLAVIKSQIKQLKDSLDSFEQAGRPEMAESIKNEITMLNAYLPAELGDEELLKVVKEAVAASGAGSAADMGKAMGAAMKAVAGQADGNRVKALVQSLLAVLVLVFGLMFTPGLAQAASANSEVINFVVPAIKITRMFLVLIGIVCINSILIGGFTMMTASMRNDIQGMGMQKMSFGIVGTLVVASLFSIATVALQRLT